ncbi:hypothetical protein AB0442_27540 [Kitasatospora sp. NPDC085895]|uniref:hypothetical protein n=1 Tax=Kitasatospora sp. NPDC085895 TaxID=3155057 RepID=UPI00344B22DB
MVDAIVLLRDDHKTVEKLFKAFEKAGEDEHAEKRRIADEVIEELTVHAVIEEEKDWFLEVRKPWAATASSNSANAWRRRGRPPHATPWRSPARPSRPTAAPGSLHTDRIRGAGPQGRCTTCETCETCEEDG